MTAKIGHNNPPDAQTIFNEGMEDAHGKELKEIALLYGQAVETVTNDKEAEAAADLIQKINKAKSWVVKTHKDEKEPYLSGGRAVDAFFKDVTVSLDKAKEKSEAPLTAYTLAKTKAAREKLAAEAEALRLKAQETDDIDEAVQISTQAQKTENLAVGKASKISKVQSVSSSASVRSRWVGEIEDKSKLDLEALRPFLSDDALQKALNAYVAFGNRAMTGARIYEDFKAIVR